MKLAELDQFLQDCIKAEIAFPKETMTVVVDDFYEAVPEDKRNMPNLEFRTFIGQEMAVVLIIPKQPELNLNQVVEFQKKAAQYDKLKAKIDKCYFNEEGEELSEEESENIDLGTIGEIAASHFGYL